MLARFRFDRNLQRADALVREASERYRVEDVSIEEPDLESIIRRIYVEGYYRRLRHDRIEQSEETEDSLRARTWRRAQPSPAT